MKLLSIILLLLISTTCLATEKIQKTPSTVFCGKYGKYPDNTGEYKFDISTRAEARAALSYAWWAPYPLGIKLCVCNYYPDFPSCQYTNALRIINNYCGDVWCEGQYNYDFTKIDKSWTLYYTTIELYKPDGIYLLDQPLYHRSTCKIDKFENKIPTTVINQITDCMEDFHKQLTQIRKSK